MRLCVLGLFASCLFVTARTRTAAEQERAWRLPASSASEKAIVDALDRPITLLAVKTSLADIVANLEKTTEISIRFDPTSMEEAGLAPNTKVTIDVESVSLRSALKTMLKEHGLTWVIDDEALLITTYPCDAKLVNYLYDVRDLVIVGRYGEPDFEPLIELITSSIVAQSWDEVGGPGSITTYENDRLMGLVITQTQPIQDEIMLTLEMLRKASDAQGPAMETGPLLQSRPFDSPISQRHTPRRRQRTYADSPRWIMPRVHD